MIFNDFFDSFIDIDICDGDTEADNRRRQSDITTYLTMHCDVLTFSPRYYYAYVCICFTGAELFSMLSRSVETYVQNDATCTLIPLTSDIFQVISVASSID